MNRLREQLIEIEDRLRQLQLSRELILDLNIEEQEHGRELTLESLLLSLDELEGWSLLRRAELSKLIDHQDELDGRTRLDEFEQLLRDL